MKELQRNGSVIQSMLRGMSQEQYQWRESPEKWSLLEVICHLYDEEREDFRARVQSTLETPEKPWDSIDPAGWVKSRNYAEREFEPVLENFLMERNRSVEWLMSLNNPSWHNAYIHPKVGPVTAKLLLVNWLAHDYLHIRQITRIQYNFLKEKSEVKMDYAGDW